MDAWQPDEIRRLVQALGEAGGTLSVSAEQIGQLRDFFGQQALRGHVDEYVRMKHRQHVDILGEWPEDTTPEQYLESLRTTVLDPRTAIYLANAGPVDEWTIYFVGRVRRAWRGPRGSNRVVVIFNAERHFLITGFQPERE